MDGAVPPPMLQGPATVHRPDMLLLADYQGGGVCREPGAPDIMMDAAQGLPPPVLQRPRYSPGKGVLLGPIHEHRRSAGHPRAPGVVVPAAQRLPPPVLELSGTIDR